MRRLIIDIETDALKNPTTIWCICTMDYDTGETKEYVLGEVNDFKVEKDTTYIGHNIIDFDIPVLQKLLGLEFNVNQLRDTLILSRLFNPVREDGHSLESWGVRVGLPKQEFNEFSRFSDTMLEYCKNDVAVTAKAYTQLMVEGKEFSDFSIKLEHQVSYVIHKQKEYGFYLHKDKAIALYNEVKQLADDLELQIQSSYPPKKVLDKVYKVRYNDNGLIHKTCQKILDQYSNNKEYNENTDTWNLYSYQPFNLGSPKQVVERMNEAGWKPTEFTKAGAPKVCEENLLTLPDTAPESAKLLPRWLILNSRHKTILQWIEGCDENNRVHGDVYTVGAITHRMAHSNPNMANIPSVGGGRRGIEGGYGYECRDCWGVASEDRRLVGVDAKAIQLRILAHYMNDPDYIKAVTTGDIHTVNKELAGLATRDQAKTFIYAWLLGAGAAKVGSIINSDSKAGQAVKDKFLERLPPLRRLQEETHVVARKGYLVGLDGRRLPIKSAHYALSSYLQGGEAVIMKLAVVLAYKEFTKLGLDAHFVANVHDEVQIDCHKNVTGQVGEIMVQCICKAGVMLNLKCPMDGEYKVGNTWAETH